MRLFKITPTVRLRVKTMILNLFTEYDYVKVHKSGLVSLKRRWWSLKRDRVSITDLIVGEIPKRIAEVAHLGGKGDEYLRVFSSHIAAIIHVSSYSTNFNIVDYVWDKFTDLCLEVPFVTLKNSNLELNEKKEQTAISLFGGEYWFGIIKSLKLQALPPSTGHVKWSLKRHPTLLQKVNEIKNKVL